MPASPLETLVDELALVAGRIEREAALRIEAAISNLRRIDAERELRLARLERDVADRLAVIEDGKDADPAVIARMVGDAVAALPAAPAGKDADPALVASMVDDAVARAVVGLPAAPAGKDADPAVIARTVAEAVAALPAAPAGKDADPALVASMVDDAVARAVAGLPAAPAGKDADPAVIARMVGDAVAALPAAPAGKDGKLPVVREWSDRVHYEGAVVVHDGQTYQAIKDTGRKPGHDDWICLARAGRDGQPGRSFRVEGTFEPARGDYRELDIVVLNGASFLARTDNPGPCPGEGWQLIASQGKRGAPGERGQRGDAAKAVVRLDISDEALLTLTNGDGSRIDLDLYPLLSAVSRA
jgi:hypothetical protein